MNRLSTSSVIGGVVLALALTACGGGTPGSTKYVQTWTKAYGETTCPEWTSTMNDHQRFVMAADILFSLRKKEGASNLPPDDLVTGFVSDIGSVCDAAYGQGGGLIPGAAAVVYVDQRFHP